MFMRVALISLNQVWEDKEKNKELCQWYIKEAAAKKSDLIVFPEMTLTGFTMKNASIYSENILKSETVSFFQNESKNNSIGIIFGFIARGEKISENKLVYLNKKGEIVGDYSKIHPFSFATEDSFFKGGNQVKYASFENINVGLSICYDLRFPELFQILSKHSEIIVNIANWPKKRVKHWKSLSMARAIENQVFFIGVNRTGTDGNGLEYEESSLIVNPNGDVLEEVYLFNDMKVFEIELSNVKRIRTEFPVKNDRKIDLYKKLL